MRLSTCTWIDVKEYLERKRIIIVPIGSHEQHGPNGLVGTDAICAEAAAARAGELAGVLVAPGVPFGVAHYHLGFPGSLSLRPTTLIDCVFDLVSSLVKSGFNRFFFVNGHGGNVAPLQTAFQSIQANRSFLPDRPGDTAPRFELVNWWEGPRATESSRRLFGPNEGMHAVASEVSVTYHLFPSAIRASDMVPEIAPCGPILDAWDYRQRFPDGRIGSSPGRAIPAAGAEILAAAVDDIAEGLARFEASA